MVTFLGYHGTTRKSAEQIRDHGFQRMSTGCEQWLGTGYYFFQDSESWARWWTDEIRQLQNGSIVKAEIRVARDSVLDLLDLNTMREFHKLRRAILKRLGRAGKRERVVCPFDGIVLDMLCSDSPSIRVIRAAFPEPDKHRDETIRLNESRIRRIHIQLCCKDAGCIDVLSIDGEELTSRSQTESTRKGA